jgi:hypothetical protein
MPEFVTCPSCGLRVQMAEGLLGRPVRCAGCDHRYVAAADPPAPPRPLPPQRPARAGPPPGTQDEWDDGGPLPFCPGCGRQVPWEALRCPYCEEELEPELGAGRPRRPWPPRRLDAVPHRGKLLVTLGNISLALGGLSLCTLGAGALLSIPLGVTAWVMASHDLGEMRAGRMDPRGKSAAETARTGGILGVVLGLIFGAFYAVIYLASY